MIGLSKSKYTTFCQCAKALWLKTYKPEVEKIDDITQSRFEKGTAVGELAKGIFGPFVDVTVINGDGSQDLPAMIANTEVEMQKGSQNICEASFSLTKEGISHYCAVDILHMTEDGWEIYEVKSSSFTNDKEDTEDKLRRYSRDIAYQKWVMENCGINVTGTFLVRLDSNYMRKGELDLKALFHIKDISEYIVKESDDIEFNVAEAGWTLNDDREPSIKLGKHCNSPYSCSFKQYCMRNIPAQSVFNLYGMSMAKKARMYYDGITRFEDLKGRKISKIQKLQVDCSLNNEYYISPEKINEFLKKLHYPLYFLDFETMQPAIPPFDNSKPLQQIPFQYSLHWKENEDGELKHSEFLGNSKDDPRRELAEKLCREIPRDACVTAYNKTFECGRLEEMAEIFPDLHDHLIAISENIVDLIEPFRNGWVYYPAMNGSFSVKSVLPALFPEDESLNYQNLLGSVHNGSEAMNVYPSIGEMSIQEAEATRKSLLEYCCLDTLAMVKIWEKLKELAVITE